VAIQFTLSVSEVLESILGILTIALVFLTIGLLVLASRAEKLLEGLTTVLKQSVDVQTSLLHVQFLLTVSTVDRTIEVPLVHFTKKIEQVMYDLNDITADARLEVGVVGQELEVSYRLSYEDAVYEVLRKSVDDASCLPEKVYQKLVA
jgi:hypothetical protein